MSSWKGVEWATWHASLGSTLFQQPKWYVDFVALFAWNVSYKALYDLGYMLHNPFGDRRIDVAHEVIGTNSFRCDSQCAPRCINAALRLIVLLDSDFFLQPRTTGTGIRKFSRSVTGDLAGTFLPSGRTFSGQYIRDICM
jgi:hypothetical protein